MQFTNTRSGETIDSPFTHQQALDLFLAAHADHHDNWLWFWLHKAAMKAAPAQNGHNHKKAIQFLCDSFVVALGRGLKRPMIRLHFRDQRFKIYLSQRGTLCIKTGELMDDRGTKQPVGDEHYMGCLLRGEFLPATKWDRNFNRRGPERPLSDTEKAFLEGVQTNPVEFMAQCSRDMDRCCYCSVALEDERSKKVGYGKICANRWGLPWGDTKYLENAPSFAKVHGETASVLCDAIRKDQDEVAWLALSDWLVEHGLPPVKMPAIKVAVPRTDSN